jgi:hypothetical protein
MKFKRYINEKSFDFKQYKTTNEYNKLFDIVSKYRKDLEAYYSGHLEDIDNTCQDESERLANILVNNGFNAKKYGGYYYGISDQWEPPDNKPAKKWKHYWVVIDNNIIVDVTADQFHPEERKEWSIVIEPKRGNKDYR